MTQNPSHGQLKFSTRRGPDGPAIIYHMSECDHRLWTEERDWHFREVVSEEVGIEKRRQWDVEFVAGSGGMHDVADKCVLKTESWEFPNPPMKVREVLPDEVCITRHELEQALSRVAIRKDWDEPFATDAILGIVREFFDEPVLLPARGR